MSRRASILSNPRRKTTTTAPVGSVVDKSKTPSQISQDPVQVLKKPKKKLKVESNVIGEFLSEEDGKTGEQEIRKWDPELLKSLRAPHQIEKIRDEMTRFMDAIPALNRVETLTIRKTLPPRPPSKTKIPVGVVSPAPINIEYTTMLLSSCTRSTLEDGDRCLRQEEEILSEVTKQFARPTVGLPEGELRLDLREKLELPEPVDFRDEGFNQERVFEAWKEVLHDREIQRKSIIERINRDPSDLLMGEAITYRKCRMVKKKGIVNGVLKHKCNPQRGKRPSKKRDALWSVPLFIGDRSHEICTTLTQRELGHTGVTEYVTVPRDIKSEMGYVGLNKAYQIKHFIEDEKTRNLKDLCLTSTNQWMMDLDEQDIDDGDYQECLTPVSSRTEEIPIIIRTSRQSPGLKFGRYHINMVDPGIEIYAELGMPGSAGDILQRYLTIKNTSRLAIHYHWEMVPETILFDSTRRDKKKVFYFDTRYGVLLPWEIKNIILLVKSDTAGIFTETWRFLTRPKLCENRGVFVTLWACIEIEDFNQSVRQDIEDKLSNGICSNICSSIMDNIVYTLMLKSMFERAADRQTYLEYEKQCQHAEDEVFAIKNKGHYYHSTIVNKLRSLYPVDDTSGDENVLSLQHLRKSLLSADELPTRPLPDTVTSTVFSGLVDRLVPKVETPMCSANYRICQSVLIKTLDKISGEIMLLQARMRVTTPEKQEGEETTEKLPEETVVKKDKEKDKQPIPPPQDAGTTKGGKGSSMSRRRQFVKERVLLKETKVKKEEKLRPLTPDDFAKYKKQLYTLVYGILEESFDHLSRYLD